MRRKGVILKNIYDVLDNAETGRKVYVYGAGIVAYYVVRDILKESNVKIEAFLVSDTKGNPASYFNIPIQKISDAVTLDSHIIIATLENLQDEIKDFLNDLGYKNIYAITDADYAVLRAKHPDMSAENFRELRELNQKICGHTHREALVLHEHLNQIHEHLHKDTFVEYEHLNNVWQYIISRNNEPVLRHEREKIRYEYDFKELISNQEEYKLKVNKLVKNLDSESRDIVFQILHRLNLLCEGKQINEFAFTEKEKEIVRRLRSDFYPRIYKIAEDWYCYKEYVLPKNHFEVSVFWYEHGMTELKHPEYIKEKDIIDAGAYIGDSAIVLSKYTSGKVHSFEAIKENFECIEHTAQMNQLQNIVPVNMGLSDAIGEEVIYVSSSDTCNGLKADNVYTFEDGEKQVIKCTTIDHYVENNQLQIGLIKTDVEGAEQRLLKGAIKTIQKQKPTLIISIYHSVDDFFAIKAWLEDLDLGYKFRIIRPVEQHLFMGETILLAEVD